MCGSQKGYTTRAQLQGRHGSDAAMASVLFVWAECASCSQAFYRPRFLTVCKNNEWLGLESSISAPVPRLFTAPGFWNNEWLELEPPFLHLFPGFYRPRFLKQWMIRARASVSAHCKQSKDWSNEVALHHREVEGHPSSKLWIKNSKQLALLRHTEL